MPDTKDRRIDDNGAHAHKRGDDEFARLHKRMDDNEALMNELMKARFEMINQHKETSDSLKALAEAVEKLAFETAGIRQSEKDVEGMMRILSRASNTLGILWKPILFIAVLGGWLYLWAHGKLP